MLRYWHQNEIHKKFKEMTRERLAIQRVWNSAGFWGDVRKHQPLSATALLMVTSRWCDGQSCQKTSVKLSYCTNDSAEVMEKVPWQWNLKKNVFMSNKNPLDRNLRQKKRDCVSYYHTVLCLDAKFVLPIRAWDGKTQPVLLRNNKYYITKQTGYSSTHHEMTDHKHAT